MQMNSLKSKVAKECGEGKLCQDKFYYNLFLIYKI